MKWALFICISLILVLILVPYVGDNDFWFHLRIGKELVNSQSFIDSEPFSFTQLGHQWSNHEWIFQVTIFTIYAVGGFGMIAAITACLGTTTVLLSHRKDWNILSVFVATVTAFALRPFIVPRPQIFAYLALATLLLMLYRYQLSFQRRYLFGTALVVWFWANTHASVILVLPIFLYYCFEFLFGALKTTPREKRLEFFIAIIATLFLTLINPLSYKIYTEALQPIQYREVFSTLIETTPLVKHLGSFPGIAILFTHIAIGTILIWQLLKRRGSRFGWVQYVLGLGFWMMPWVSIKYAPFAWMVTLPMVFVALPKWEINKTLKASLMAVLLIFGVLFAWNLGGARKSAESDWPKNLVSFLKEHKLKGNMFNSLSWGGYIAWSLPEKPVFIWGGCDCFYDKEYFDAIDFAKGERVDEILSKYSLDIALVRPWESLAYSLSTKPDWTLVYWDNFGMAYARKTLENREVIEKYALDVPYFNDTVEATVRKFPGPKLAKLFSNYEEAIRRQPDLVYAKFKLGLLYQGIGRCDLAVSQWKSITDQGEHIGLVYQKLLDCSKALNQAQLQLHYAALAQKYKDEGKLWLGRP